MPEEQSGDLDLIGLWIVPPSPVLYLEDRLVHVELQNNSGREIHVEMITCSFQTEKDLEKHKITDDHPICLLPKHRKSISMPLNIGLEMGPSTNSPILEVTYTVNCSRRTKKFDYPVHSLMISPIPLREKYFFISHKIPKDTGLAKRLEYYLQKIGFGGYVAEENPKLGYPLWDEKIYPAIDKCTGLIVLWTVDARKSSEFLIKEMVYAKNCDKTAMHIIEGKSPPSAIAGQPEEYQMTCRHVTESDLVKLVRRIHTMYEQGDF